MKKYLFGLSAVVMAIAFSAFTVKKTNFTSRLFHLSSASFLTSASQVEDVQNWDYTGSSSPIVCDDYSAPDRACTILVDEAFLVNLGGGQFRLRLPSETPLVDDDHIIIDAVANGAIYKVDDIKKDESSPVSIVSSGVNEKMNGAVEP
jgi:hypothetical protein